jgi:hypothetical protein
MTPTYDLETIKQKVTVDLPAKVEALVVDSDDGLVTANEIWKGTRTAADFITDLTKDSIKTTKAAYDAARDLRDGLLAHVKKAQEIIEGKIRAYRAMLAQKAREEEDRIKAEAKAKEDAERVKVLEDTPLFDEVPRVTTPAPTPFIRPASPLPKMEGTSFPKTWKYNLVNPSLLPDELTVRVPNELMIGTMVRALKTSKNQAGDIEQLKSWGIEAYEHESMRRN